MNYTIIDLKKREAPYTWFMIQAWCVKGPQKIRQLTLETDDLKTIQIIYSTDEKFTDRHVTLYNANNNKTYHTRLKDKEILKNEKALEELKLSKTLEDLLKKVN